MPLYGVAIVQKATKKELEDGAQPEKLVAGPLWVTARDPNSAAIAAVTGPNAPPGVDFSKCEVQVSPFA